MSESERPSTEQMSRMVQQHLASLQGAGVEWLPLSKEPLPIATAPSANVVAPAPADNIDPREARRVALTVLEQQVTACTRCSQLASTRTRTVFGVGPLDAELCFLGEAPGADEDRQGEPFVGAAGQLLNRIIAACGMKREEVYICNILRCRPPGNRQPNPEEAANCREYLDRQLELIRPRYICCLGATAAQNLLGINATIGKMRGRFYDYNGITVLATYHPSYLLRSPENKKYVWEDMKLLLAKMGRVVPGK